MNSHDLSDETWYDNTFLRKRVVRLQKQVDELMHLLKQEEDQFDADGKVILVEKDFDNP